MKAKFSFQKSVLGTLDYALVVFRSVIRVCLSESLRHSLASLLCTCSFSYFLCDGYCLCDCRVPDSQDVSFGELKQGKKCLDTLGSQAGGSIGMFDCHGQAGNQVRQCIVLHDSR